MMVTIIEAAVRMAEEIQYLGLGTWEFLVNTDKGLLYFLEINPRLQVEHTITEGITGLDLVRIQLLLAQAASLEEVGLGEMLDPWRPPPRHSMQLRLCAEDSATFAPSIGKIKSFHIPSGNGVRVDTHLAGPSLGVVRSDFDNLIAKIIVTASTREALFQKASRSLEDTEISGVETNLNLLRAIVADEIFQDGAVDTSWLEKNAARLMKGADALSSAVARRNHSHSPISESSSDPSSRIAASNTTVLRKGDAWSIHLEPLNRHDRQVDEQHYLHLSRILRNEFPTSLTAEVSHTISSRPDKSNIDEKTTTTTTTTSTTTPYRLTIQSTTASTAALSSPHHKRGKVNDPSHIIIPTSGKLIEILIQEGDEIREGQVIAFIKQMKMELEIRSPRAGRVRWVMQLEGEEGAGEDVAEGVLLAEVAEGEGEEEVGARALRMMRWKL
jgi:acetyl/propionyl-CoA carboxylase alpha subunit